MIVGTAIMDGMGCDSIRWEFGTALLYIHLKNSKVAAPHTLPRLSRLVFIGEGERYVT